jgi:Fic family protein
VQFLNYDNEKPIECGFDRVKGGWQMRYFSVAEMAKKWDVSERSVRNYCAHGRVPGAFITGKTWNIPENAKKPERSNKKKEKKTTLLDILLDEKTNKYSGGIYHKTQIDLTYNSNHMEGSRLTHDQTRYIFETNTIGIEKEVLNVDDVIETANHFRCIDMIIDYAKATLTENFIKKLHLVLKNGTSDSRKDWFVVGDYKKMPNEVGGMETALPEEVADRMKKLLSEYNNQEEKALEDILNFHVKFECIHPFQDGNGRVGRLIMFKECLKYNIVPFIIEDNLKMFYYRGLKEWNNEKGYLTDTCLTAQDQYKAYLDYFRIAY